MSATRVPDATDPRDDGLAPPSISIFQGDARATGLDRNSVNAIVGSPPYWRKRDYGHDDQIGMESTPDGYVDSIADCLTDWKRVLHPTGSVFLNIGDSYLKRSLVGIPGKIETAAHKMGWTVRNRVIWTKTGGMPDPCRSRLVGRHEYVIHLVRGRNYYYDLTGYQDHLGVTSNPGDVWQIEQERSMSAHLAPFPSELVRQAHNDAEAIRSEAQSYALQTINDSGGYAVETIKGKWRVAIGLIATTVLVVIVFIIEAAPGR